MFRKKPEPHVGWHRQGRHSGLDDGVPDGIGHIVKAKGLGDATRAVSFLGGGTTKQSQSCGLEDCFSLVIYRRSHRTSLRRPNSGKSGGPRCFLCNGGTHACGSTVDWTSSGLAGLRLDERSDQELALASRRGDRTAYALLVRRHYKSVFLVAWACSAMSTMPRMPRRTRCSEDFSRSASFGTARSSAAGSSPSPGT